MSYTSQLLLYLKIHSSQILEFGTPCLLSEERFVMPIIIKVGLTTIQFPDSVYGKIHIDKIRVDQYQY